MAAVGIVWSIFMNHNLGFINSSIYLRKITDKTEIESGSKFKDGRTMIPLYAENKNRTIHWATEII